MNRSLWALLTVICVSLAAAGPSRAAGVQVTYLEGGVFLGGSEDGPWQALELFQAVTMAGFILTGDDGIVELTLADASMVRLAPESLYQIREVAFAPDQPRRFVAKLFFGKLWAKVRKSTARMAGRFETRIPTAVIGVRGTVYNLAAARDRSAEIFVYEGLVGIGPPALVEGAPREEIEWPSQVTEGQWEEIILAKLQRLSIDADGRPGQPRTFDPQAVRDRWVVFNQQRDARRP